MGDLGNMPLKDPKEFVKDRVLSRAKETENVKNASVFDIDYKPKKILIRKELEKVTDDMADYFNLGVPRHIIIYGSKGSGKTLSAISIADGFRETEGLPYYYVNVRENPTSKKIYRAMTGLYSKGNDLSEVKDRLDRMLSKKSLIILDEIDFLLDYDALYHFTRNSKSNLLLLTQKVYWYKTMTDESVKSSLQPDHIVFHEYNAQELRDILIMRAIEGLNYFEESAISMLAAYVVREYRSDARIGIKALEILGRLNKWDEDSVVSSLKQAYVEVEGETLKSLSDRDLIVLASLIRNVDTNRAYEEVSRIDYFIVKGLSKSTFFQSVNYLQNLGLINLIKKRSGRYYTMESQILLSDPSIVSGELKKRI